MTCSDSRLVVRKRRGLARWRLLAMACGTVVIASGLQTLSSSAQDEPQRARQADRRGTELSDEEVEIVLAIIAERQPTMAQRLTQLKESDPEQFRQSVARLVSNERLRPLMMMRRTDPEGFELHVAAMRAKAQAGRLRRQLHQIDSASAVEAQQQLRQAAEEVIDSEFKLREHELAQLRKRLEQLQQDLSHRRENRDELVEQYYQRLTSRRGEALGP